MNKKVAFGICVVALLVIFNSCGGSKDKELEQVEVDGSGVEMVFKEFSENGDAVVVFSNHMEANLKEFKAEAYWLDEDGNYIIGFMDEPDYFPFHEKGTTIAESGVKLEYITMIDIDDMAPEGTASVEMKILYAKFDDGSEWFAEEE